MKDSFRGFLLAALALMVLAAGSHARIFTDTEGREVEATLIGVKDGKAVLEKDGKRALWPVNQFSAEDQLYIREWLEKPPPIKTAIQVFERKGKRRTVSEGGSGDGPKTEREVDEEPYHYDVYLTNQSDWSSGELVVRYRLFAVDPEGELREKAGRKSLDNIPGRERATFETDEIGVRSIKEVSRVRKTVTRLGGGEEDDGDDKNDDFRKVSKMEEQIERRKESFGGIWIRVYQGDRMVGETKKLTPAAKALEPKWTEADDAPPDSEPEALKDRS